MGTIIFRTVAPFLTSLMVIFSIFVLLRGHNEPGGGFIGGLIAVSAVAIYGAACGVATARRAMHYHPITLAAFGLFMSTLAGLLCIFYQVPFLTGIWWPVSILGQDLYLSTVLFFDVGVYLVVVGAIASIVLSLEEKVLE